MSTHSTENDVFVATLMTNVGHVCVPAIVLNAVLPPHPAVTFLIFYIIFF